MVINDDDALDINSDNDDIFFGPSEDEFEGYDEEFNDDDELDLFTEEE